MSPLYFSLCLQVVFIISWYVVVDNDTTYKVLEQFKVQKKCNTLLGVIVQYLLPPHFCIFVPKKLLE